MNKTHTPDSVAAPFGPYSHAVEVPPGARLLYISGEVGALPDGTVPEGVEAQADACWQNIIAILADALGAQIRSIVLSPAMSTHGGAMKGVSRHLPVFRTA